MRILMACSSFVVIWTMMICLPSFFFSLWVFPLCFAFFLVVVFWWLWGGALEGVSGNHGALRVAEKNHLRRIKTVAFFFLFSCGFLLDHRCNVILYELQCYSKLTCVPLFRCYCCLFGFFFFFTLLYFVFCILAFLWAVSLLHSVL